MKYNYFDIKNQNCNCSCVMGERKRESERDEERERDGERERKRERERERKRARERDGERARERDGEREKESDRERKRARERETGERERESERRGERERESERERTRAQVGHRRRILISCRPRAGLYIHSLVSIKSSTSARRAPDLPGPLCNCIPRRYVGAVKLRCCMRSSGHINIPTISTRKTTEIQSV